MEEEEEEVPAVVERGGTIEELGMFRGGGWGGPVMMGSVCRLEDVADERCDGGDKTSGRDEVKKMTERKIKLHSFGF